MRLEGRKVEMTTLTEQLHKTREGVLYICGKVLAVGSCRGCLCGKRSALLHTVDCHANQKIHLRTKQGPSANLAVSLEKNILRRKKIAGQAEEEGKNKGEN